MGGVCQRIGGVVCFCVLRGDAMVEGFREGEECGGACACGFQWKGGV